MKLKNQHTVPIVTFLCILFCYAFFIHYIGSGSWNATSRLNLTFALAEKGTFTIDDYHENTGDKALYKGHYYSDKAPGTSFLAVPAYKLLKLCGITSEKYIQYWLSVIVIGLPSAILGLLFLQLLQILGVENAWVRTLITLSYSLGTMAFPFSTIFYGHQMAAVFGIFSFYILLRMRLKTIPEKSSFLWLSGFLSGWAYLSDYPAGIIVVFVGLYCLWVIKEKKLIFYWALGVAVPVGISLFYNTSCFGGPFTSAYKYHVTFNHHSGFLGITLPKFYPFWEITFGSHRGIFFQSPILLFVFPGTWLLYKNKDMRREFWLFLSIVVSFVLFNSGYAYWDGIGSAGARFLIPCLPFIVLLSSCAVKKWPKQAELLAILSVTFMIIINATEPRVAWKIHNPLFNFNFFLFLKGYMSDNLGMYIGLKKWLSLAPLFVVISSCIIFIRKSVPKASLPKWNPKKTGTAIIILFLLLSWFAIAGLKENSFLREFDRAEGLLYHYQCSGNVELSEIKKQYQKALLIDPHFPGLNMRLQQIAFIENQMQLQ